MARRRVFYLLALGGCGVFYLFYQQWLSWLLLLALLMFPWLSLAMSVPAMVSYEVGIGCRPRLNIQDREEIWLMGSCRGPLPPAKGKIRLTHRNTGKSRVLQTGDVLPAEHCGGWEAVPLRPRVYDYLGLFSLRIRRVESSMILVEPEPHQMPVPPDLTRYLARSWRPKPGGGYSENHELRLYRPGDSLNQVHWKLSAKTGDLIIREPMEPERGLMLLTLDVAGTPEELDRKYGRLLWLGTYMLEQGLRFEVQALTGNGLESWPVTEESGLHKCVDALLCAAPAAEGTVRELEQVCSWQYHIGGEADET